MDEQEQDTQNTCLNCKRSFKCLTQHLRQNHRCSFAHKLKEAQNFQAGQPDLLQQVSSPGFSLTSPLGDGSASHQSVSTSLLSTPPVRLQFASPSSVGFPLSAPAVLFSGGVPDDGSDNQSVCYFPPSSSGGDSESSSSFHESNNEDCQSVLSLPVCDRIVLDFEVQERSITHPNRDDTSQFDPAQNPDEDLSLGSELQTEDLPESFFFKDAHHLSRGGTSRPGDSPALLPDHLSPDQPSHNPLRAHQHDGVPPVSNSDAPLSGIRCFDFDRTEDEISRDLFLQNQKLHAKGYTTAKWTKDTEHLVRLVDICGEGGIPLGVFDKVLEWAQNASRDGVFRQNERLPRRQKFLDQLSQFVGTEGMTPVEEKVTLPCANVDVMVTTIDAKAAIMSLLNDRDLMRACNLNWFDDDHKVDIFSAPLSSAEALELAFRSGTADDLTRPDPHAETNDYQFIDVLSGTEARRVYDYKVKVRGKEMIVPIIEFIDKTHIDRHGRACQEPVCITLGIFKKEVREQPYAWRAIGYVPNQSMHVTAKSSHGKSIDYHAVLRHIHVKSGLAELMKKPVYWEFPAGIDAGGVPRKGLLHFYFGFLTGDTEGNDKASGHYTCRSSRVSHLCRKCNTDFQHISDPFFTFQLLDKATISSKSTCNDFSFHYIPDGTAFDVLDFGYNGRYCHIAHWCANDYMHIKRLGIQGYAIKGFRTLEKRIETEDSDRGKRSKKRKRDLSTSDHEEDDDDGGDGEDSTVGDMLPMEDELLEEGGVVEDGDDVSEKMGLIPNIDEPAKVKHTQTTKNGKKGKDKIKRNRLFSDNPKYVAEKAMLIWGVLLSQQSARNFPRTYFPQGALSTEKLNAHEYQGLMILYLLLLCSTLGCVWFEEKDKEEAKQNYNSAGWLGNEAVDAWVHLFEILILQDGFIRKESMSMEELCLYKRYTPLLLDEYRRTLDRKEGVGMSFVKFHIGLHDADDILRFGPMSGFDTGVGETNHKELSKKTAARTQKRAKTLDFQSARRLQENTTIHLANSRLDGPKQEEPTLEPLNNTDGIHSVLSSFTAEDGFLVSAGNSREAKSMEWYDSALQKEVSKFLEKNILGPLEVESVDVPGYIKKNGVLYRAQPSRKATRNYVSGWNDWAIVDWGGVSVVPQDSFQRRKGGTGKKRKGHQKLTVAELELRKKAEIGDTYLRESGGRAPVHILCFIDLDEAKIRGKDLTIMGRIIDRPGVYAVCHAVTQHPPDALANGDSVLLKRATKDMKHDGYHILSAGILNMYIIHTDSIVAPCACVPDIWPGMKRGARDLDPYSKNVFVRRAEYILVETPDRWPGLFLQMMKRQLETRESSSDSHSDSGGSEGSVE